jgi:hypothetical protein
VLQEGTQHNGGQQPVTGEGAAAGFRDCTTSWAARAAPALPWSGRPDGGDGQAEAALARGVYRPRGVVSWGRRQGGGYFTVALASCCGEAGRIAPGAASAGSAVMLCGQLDADRPFKADNGKKMRAGGWGARRRTPDCRLAVAQGLLQQGS